MTSRNERLERSDALDALREARLGDPTGDEAGAAADRILARVSLRIRSQQRRRTGWRWAVAASALVAVGFGVASRVDNEPTTPKRARVSAPTPTAEAPGAWRPWVERALAGEAVARNRLRAGGRAAREAVLQAAEDEGFADRSAALRLLRVSGPLEGAESIERVARLVSDPTVRPSAVALLARSLGSKGVRALGQALVEAPTAEAEVVNGLRRVARGGRREAALGALLRGVEVGRVSAVIAALEIAGPMRLPRVLAAMPTELARAEGVPEAVREATDLVRLRLVRLAGRGNVNAMHLVGEARLPEATGVLTIAANGTDEVLALASVRWLRRAATVDADVGLARTLASGDSVAAAARAALRDATPQRLEALVARARRSHRDRLAALRALGAAAGGATHLARVAQDPRMFEAAVLELAACEFEAASHALAGLGRERHRFDDALRGLIVRLRDRRAGAVEGLLALARGTDARSVLRELIDVDEAAPVFEAARGDVGLAPHADAVRRERVMRRERIGPRRRQPGVARVRPRHRGAI